MKTVSEVNEACIQSGSGSFRIPRVNAVFRNSRSEARRSEGERKAAGSSFEGSIFWRSTEMVIC